MTVTPFEVFGGLVIIAALIMIALAVRLMKPNSNPARPNARQ